MADNSRRRHFKRDEDEDKDNTRKHQFKRDENKDKTRRRQFKRGGNKSKFCSKDAAPGSEYLKTRHEEVIPTSIKETCKFSGCNQSCYPNSLTCSKSDLKEFNGEI